MSPSLASPPNAGRQLDQWFVRAMLAILLAIGAVSMSAARPANAQSTQQFGLTSFCTAAENYPAFRSFRVTNLSAGPVNAVLVNQSINQSINIVAPSGQSFWNVPAQSGNNTVILVVNNAAQAVKASNNKVCAVLAGNASCNAATGQTTLTWTLKNNDTGAVSISSNSGGLTFAPNPVPANGSSTATQTLAGPAATQTFSLTVTVQLGQGVVSSPTATVTAGTCLPPPPPPLASWTFQKAASTTSAEVAAVVTYTYFGTNTGNVPLEVVGLIDDRLGIVIVDDATVTLVAPGETITRQVTYTVRVEDAGTTIINNAVVGVRPIIDGVPGNITTSVATAQVVVPQLPEPPEILPPTPDPPPPTTTPPGGGTPLPGTGSNNGVLVATAFALIAMGLAATRLSRR